MASARGLLMTTPSEPWEIASGRQGPALATRPAPVIDRPKLDRGRDPKRNENEQPHPLHDRERQLGPSRRERVQGRDLHEALCDKHEHVEIKRRNRAADKNPPPRSGEAKAVIGGDRADQQNEREHAHGARRVEAERGQRETGQARQDRRQKEDRDRRPEIPAEQKAVQHHEPGKDSDQTYRHVELKHCRLPNLGREANRSIVARVSPSGNFFLLPPRYNIYMSRCISISGGLALRGSAILDLAIRS